MSIYVPTSSIELIETLRDNGVNANFHPYEDIHKFEHINQLIPSIILYQLSDIGHFVCVFRNKEGIQFFDPLGFFPDDQLKNANSEAINFLHHDYTYLLKLLLESNEKIIYNQYRLQNIKTSTCGMWCVVRLLLSDLTCDQFYKLFKDKKNKDKTIVDIFNGL